MSKVTRTTSIVFGVLFVLSIAIVIITSNLRGAVGTVRLYEYGYDKYNVSTVTGIQKEELLEITEELIAYLTIKTQELELSEYFNQRELIHLIDVKDLIQFFYLLQEISLVYVICYVIFGALLSNRHWWRDIAKKLILGSAVAALLLIVLGISVAADFNRVFIWFHEISFDNLLWIMQPGDLLPQLYTEGFFFEAALFLGGAIIVECLIIAGISKGYLVYSERRLMARIATGSRATTAGTGIEGTDRAITTPGEGAET